MTNTIDQRLHELGIELPTLTSPVAMFVPCVQSGNLLFVSGQVPMNNGEVMYRGRVGDEVSMTDAQAAARLCALNVLAQARVFLGDLSRITRVVQVQGFVHADSAFGDHSKVVNGASEVFEQVLGVAGKHARFAIGASGLPFRVPVEVAAVLEIA
jgi:enamine deaminase RidA (YjgF/YER057c/UK114 family)